MSSLEVSVDQEFDGGLRGPSWLGVSQKTAASCQLRLESLRLDWDWWVYFQGGLSWFLPMGPVHS